MTKSSKNSISSAKNSTDSVSALCNSKPPPLHPPLSLKTSYTHSYTHRSSNNKDHKISHISKLSNSRIRNKWFTPQMFSKKTA